MTPLEQRELEELGLTPGSSGTLRRNKYVGKTRKLIDDSLVVRLYSFNLTQLEIGRLLGFSQRSIGKALRRAGAKARSKASRIPQRAEKHPQWKGDQVGYTGAHIRVRKIRGQPMQCEVCGTEDPSKTYDWASTSPNMSDPMTFVRMCRSCHWKYDKKYLNFHNHERRKKS